MPIIAYFCLTNNIPGAWEGEVLFGRFKERRLMEVSVVKKLVVSSPNILNYGDSAD